jgi:MFS transporter, PPP family, 3-phenylpropionic acid transporter
MNAPALEYQENKTTGKFVTGCDKRLIHGRLSGWDNIDENKYRQLSWGGMMPGEPAGRLKLLIRAQYFLYFGVMGIYLPYFNLYLYHIKLTGVQIGVLSALRSVLLVLFPVLWGMLADRFQARKAIYVSCNIISAIIWSLYLYTTRFEWLVVITLGYGIFFSPIISFLEAFTMDVLGKEKQRYGQTRAWGSIAFIAVVVLVGRAIDSYPIGIVLPLILAGGLIQSMVSLGVPSVRTAKRRGLSRDIGQLVSQKSIVFLICAFLMLLSHGAYYGFFSIHLEKLGFGKTFIGISWAVASTAEIIVMIYSGRLFKRFSLENVMIFSLTIAAARWFLLAFVDSGPVILITQVLHAFTYGAFHMASILYIDALSSEASKTLGQAVNNAVSYGLGLMAGFFLSGYLYETVGSHGLFMTSGGIAVSGGMIMTVYQLGFQNRQKEPS